MDETAAETRRLLELARARDQRAFDRLFALHRPYLRKVVELRLDQRLRARVDPSDVVQDAQLEAFRRLPEYFRRRPMPFRLWLRKTAQERLVMLRRRHLGAASRAVGWEVPLPERSSLLLARQFQASGPTPSQQLDGRELARQVRQAMGRLARFRAEAAALLGLPLAGGSAR